MSIIYEALKKIEKNAGSINTTSAQTIPMTINYPKPAPKRLPVVLFVLIPVLFGLISFLAVNMYFAVLENKVVKVRNNSNVKNIKKEPSVLQLPTLPVVPTDKQETIVPAYSLQGIVYNGDKPFVVINGKTLTKFDKMDEFFISDISPNAVKLKNLRDDKELILSFQ